MIRSSSLPAQRKYPALSFFRTVLAVGGFFTAAFGLIFFFLSMHGVFSPTVIGADGQQLSGQLNPSLGGAAFGIGFLQVGLLQMAAAEGIKVFLDIQSNTLTAARKLDQLMK